MLTQEENDRLSKVGPGTPCGEMMRRYWHPVAATVQIEENPVRSVRILGEDLTLYQDRQGRLGLVGQRCAHRALDLRFGVPEDEGLRCPYHGWLYDNEGRCLEMPLEPPGSAFKHKVSIEAYPVQEMGGLIWAYLGPAPAPLLPRWDRFVRPGGIRQIFGHMLPCNWLQVAENRGDLGHAVYLHGRLFQYVLEREGRLDDDPNRRYNSTMNAQHDRMGRGAYTKYRPVYNEFGFSKGNIDSDQDEDSPNWQIGSNPILFPYLLHGGGGAGRGALRQPYQLGVPIDDNTTWHITYHLYEFPSEVEVPPQPSIPYVELPLQNERGEYVLDYVLSQDMVAWYAQGESTDRTREHLGVSDSCVIAYRKLLDEQIKVVEDGGDPINTFRDPDQNVLLEPKTAGIGLTRKDTNATYYRANYHRGAEGRSYMDDDVDRYAPDRELIQELFQKAAELQKKGQ